MTNPHRCATCGDVATGRIERTDATPDDAIFGCDEHGGTFDPLGPFDRPRDEVEHPTTKKAADGIHRLNRYRVDAVVYAPTRAEAQARIEEANVYLEAAALEPADESPFVDENEVLRVADLRARDELNGRGDAYNEDDVAKLAGDLEDDVRRELETIPPKADVPRCERCGDPAKLDAQCPGDRAYHGHGAVHTRAGGLILACERCLVDVAREWKGTERGAGSALLEASR